MLLKEYIVKARDPANWTPEFFEATESFFVENMDAIIRALRKEKIFDQIEVKRFKL